MYIVTQKFKLETEIPCIKRRKTTLRNSVISQVESDSKNSYLPDLLGHKVIIHLYMGTFT